MVPQENEAPLIPDEPLSRLICILPRLLQCLCPELLLTFALRPPESHLLFSSTQPSRPLVHTFCQKACGPPLGPPPSSSPKRTAGADLTGSCSTIRLNGVPRRPRVSVSGETTAPARHSLVRRQPDRSRSAARRRLGRKRQLKRRSGEHV